jgi:hypothetical protein
MKNGVNLHSGNRHLSRRKLREKETRSGEKGMQGDDGGFQRRACERGAEGAIPMVIAKVEASLNPGPLLLDSERALMPYGCQSGNDHEVGCLSVLHVTKSYRWGETKVPRNCNELKTVSLVGPHTQAEMPPPTAHNHGSLLFPLMPVTSVLES